jgi:hypothetical protein
LTLLYADPSALIRAYFSDEPDHERLRMLLLEGDQAVVTSEVARLELASATTAAARGGRLRRPERLLARMDLDCAQGGPIALIRLRPEVVFPAAYRLVRDHRLRTLDSLHLAVALEECPALARDDEVVFVTRDRDQAAAASALGLVLQ